MNLHLQAPPGAEPSVLLSSCYLGERALRTGGVTWWDLFSLRIRTPALPVGPDPHPVRQL